MCHKVLIQVKTISIVKKPSSGNFVTARSGEQQIKRVSILQARFFTEHILLYHSFSGSRKWGGIYLSFSWTFSWHSTCHVHKVRSSISVTLKFVFKRLIDRAGKSFVHQLGLHAISFFICFHDQSTTFFHSYYMLPLISYIFLMDLENFREACISTAIHAFSATKTTSLEMESTNFGLLWIHNKFYCLSHFVYINNCQVSAYPSPHAIQSSHLRHWFFFVQPLVYQQQPCRHCSGLAVLDF